MEDQSWPRTSDAAMSDAAAPFRDGFPVGSQNQQRSCKELGVKNRETCKLQKIITVLNSKPKQVLKIDVSLTWKLLSPMSVARSHPNAFAVTATVSSNESANPGIL